MKGLVKKSIDDSIVVNMNGYPYVVTPLMDGVPYMDPKLLLEAVEAMEKMYNFDCDLILTPEAMGIMFTTLISQHTGVPFSIIRKRSSGLDGEKAVVATTGYSTSTLYINGVEPGMKVAIVDDVVSTGGTLKKIATAVKEMGAEVVCAVVALNKSEDIMKLSKKIGIPVYAPFRISIVDGKPKSD